MLPTRSLCGAGASDQQHRELLEAARAGDVARARTVLDRHLDDAATALTRFLGER